LSAVSQLAPIEHRGQALQIEYAWVGLESASAPLIVFLHEGLGSVAMWKGFPQALCEAVGARGLVYSRPGYGQSTVRRIDERWGPDFMHVQAQEVLPALLAGLGIDPRVTPPILFGHSDGGSIALIHAASFPDQVAGLVVLAPHIMVEPISVSSIAAVRALYDAPESPLKSGLARYHASAESAFEGWWHAWMNPQFAEWSLSAELQRIRRPVLAIQGEGDEYGTFAQIDGIAGAVPRTKLIKLQDCGHSPHKDQPGAVIEAVTAFCSALESSAN
jgi:pimeloyl-ACP methyl ester carboxylesterase